MPQVPTLRPNVPLEAGNPRLTPPSTNIEAYGYGSAGDALMGLGKALSDEAIAWQARINQAKVLEASNNLQLAYDSITREQMKRNGQNVMARDATDTTEGVESVSQVFARQSEDAFQEAMRGLGNSAQRRELQAWHDRNYPTYFNNISKYENQEIEKWITNVHTTRNQISKDGFCAGVINGDMNAAQAQLDQGIANALSNANWQGVSDEAKGTVISDLTYDYLSGMTEQMTKLGRAQEVQAHIDHFKNYLTDYQYAALSQQTEAGRIRVEVKGQIQAMMNDPKYWTPYGTVDWAKIEQEGLPTIYTTTRTVTTGGTGAVLLGTGDPILQLGIAVKGGESGGDYTVTESMYGTHSGAYQMTTDYYATARQRDPSLPNYTTQAELIADPDAQDRAFYVNTKYMYDRTNGDVKATLLAHYMGEENGMRYHEGRPLIDPYILETTGQEVEIGYDDKLADGQMSANEYLQDRLSRLPGGGLGAGQPTTQTFTEEDATRKTAAEAQFAYLKAMYETQHAQAATNAQNELATYIRDNPGVGYEGADDFAKTLGQKYGLTPVETQNLQKTAGGYYGQQEQVKENDRKNSYLNAWDEVIEGKYQNVDEIKLAHPDLRPYQLEKLKPMLMGGDLADIKSTIDEAANAVAKQMGIDNPLGLYDVKTEVTTLCAEFLKERGRLPSRDEIQDMAIEQWKPFPVYQNPEGDVYSIPMASAKTEARGGTVLYQDPYGNQYRMNAGQAEVYNDELKRYLPDDDALTRYPNARRVP